MPYDGALSVLFDGLDVARKLGIDLGAETRQLQLAAGVVGNTLGKHLGEDIDRGLEVTVAFCHDAEHEVLEIAICLLFLLDWLDLLRGIYGVEEQSGTHIERAEILLGPGEL